MIPPSNESLKMEAETREDYLRERNQHPKNPAARFIETKMVIPGQEVTAYSEQAGTFVTVEEATRHEKIR